MLNEDTQAILLLTSHFTKGTRGQAKPLGPSEWGRFAHWLRDRQLRPGTLLRDDVTSVLAGWTDAKIPAQRISALLDRGSALAVAVDKWLGAGLTIITRGDDAYPKRLKKRLGSNAPPLLFACGNLKLLNQCGVGVVGGRHAEDDALDYSRNLGAKVALSGHSVISGGAGGVDSAAMQGALDSEGTVVGVLFKDMLRTVSTAFHRKHLRAGNLVFICTTHPEAGFNSGNAMQRNKYIYCLSDATVVVQSGTSGGTWSGAKENLKHGWVPTWVRSSEERQSGNEQLIALGANRLPATLDGIKIDGLWTKPLEPPTTSAAPEPEQPTAPAPPPKATLPPRVEETPPVESATPAQESFYEFFLRQMTVVARTPASKESLLEATGLCSTQLNTWLKRAIADKRMKKLNRPVRYQWADGQKDTQGSLFGDA